MALPFFGSAVPFSTQTEFSFFRQKRWLIIPTGEGRFNLILSLMRLSVGILVLILLMGLVILPADAAADSGEIVLREDGLLHSSVSTLVASIGATVCVAVVFMIVWKYWEP